MHDPGPSCVEARDLAREHLNAVRAKLAELKELKALERGIAGFVRSCEDSCAGGPGADCVVLEGLAQPAVSAVIPRRPIEMG